MKYSVDMYKIDSNYFFLKIGTRHYMEKLLKEGEIYCNTFDSFAKSAAKEIGDPLETATDFHLGKIKRIGIKDKSGDRKYFDVDVPAHLKEFHTGHVGNIYCLYALKYSDFSKSKKITLPDSLTGFGDTILVIVDIHQFLQRVKSSLTLLQKSFESKMVEYIDLQNYSGKRGPFQKDSYFSHQNEYRFYIHPTKDEEKEPFKFSLGDISDIAILCDLDSFEMELDCDE